jgi:two-component system sensor histidine kinase DesK
LAETAERERISRDLHDLLGHTLSIITLKSELAAKMLRKGLPSENILTEVEAVEQLSRETLSQVRGAVRGYNSATIEGELQQAKVATKAANIELQEQINVTSLDSHIESELALIIREAITNVIRHADTKVAEVHLLQTAEQIVLRIADHGKMTTSKENSGFRNMRTRIESIGGTMMIEKEPNTQLTFIHPLTIKNTSTEKKAK